MTYFRNGETDNAFTPTTTRRTQSAAETTETTEAADTETEQIQVIATDEKLADLIRLAATIPDTTLQRAIVNAVLDLQETWRGAVQSFVAKHRELSAAADDHIDLIAEATRLDSWPNPTEN